MAETNTIRDFVDLDTPELDAWIEASPTIKWAIKAHVVLDDTLENLPNTADLQEEVKQAFEKLNTARTDLLSELPDDSSTGSSTPAPAKAADTIITMEFQDMELKRLIAAKQLTAHKRWSAEDYDNQE